MWELDGKNDGFLQRLLGGFQPGHVAPLDVGLLHHDRVAQLALHFLLLRVVVVRVSVGVCRILEVKNCFMVCPCESKEVQFCQLVNQLVKSLRIHQMLRGKLPPLWYVMYCKTCQICLRCIQKAPFPSFLEAPPSLIGFFLEPPCQKKNMVRHSLKKKYFNPHSTTPKILQSCHWEMDTHSPSQYTTMVCL